jgi:predicted  nucleic acid-binding Zn-ribbon protein
MRERRRTVSTQMRNERWAKTFVRWFHIDDDDDNGDDDDDGDGRGVNMDAILCTATTNDGDGDDEDGMVRVKRERVDRRDARYDVRYIIACLAVHAYKQDRYRQDIDSVRQSLDEGAGEMARLMAALDDAKREADAYGYRANASDARLFTVCKKINEIIVSMRLGEAKKRGLVESLNANMAVWEKNFGVLNDDVQRAREREEVSNFAIRQLQDRMRAFEEYVEKRCNAMEATLSARLKNQEEILMEKVLMENAAANERVKKLHQAFRQEMSDKIASVIVNIANLADKKVNKAIEKMRATVSSLSETQCTKIEHNVNEKVVRLVERKFQSERANLERVYLNNARVGRELGEMSSAIEILFKSVPCLPSSERKK